MANLIPQSGKPSETPITWSDGSLFNGFLVLMLVIPTYSGVPSPGIIVEPMSPRQPIPDRVTIPIVEGILNQSTEVYYNSSIDPPNTKYCPFYYDGALKSLNTPTSSDFFVINTPVFTPPVPTLTPPVASTTVPTP